MTPFSRAVSLAIPLGLALLIGGVGASWWAVSTAHDQSLSRPLRLPATPYNYAKIELPPHFQAQPATRLDNTPSTNPITDEGATLGRVLFYDKRLSVNNTVSCGSCHVQKNAFADPNRFSKGFDGRHTDRHAMNLVDLRYYSNHRFFWDERAPGLEETVLLPIQNRLEMGQDLTRLVSLLEADRRYHKLFRSAFGSPVISPDRIGRALAQFLRSLVSYQSNTTRDALPLPPRMRTLRISRRRRIVARRSFSATVRPATCPGRTLTLPCRSPRTTESMTIRSARTVASGRLR